MRKIFVIAAAVLAIGGAAAGIHSQAQAQPYGPGMMGGYGPGYGYGRGYMMGPGYGPGYMMGPGMMYGYGADEDRAYRRGYRGERLCWKETDSARGYGYYAPCGN